MEIRQLIYFAEVCKMENMSAAAENLYLTPQALSKSILAMEQELQAPLFLREKGKLILTEMGLALWKETAILIPAFESTIARIKTIGEQEKGHIRIAFGHGIMNMLKEDFLQSYQNAHRNVYFDMIELPDIFAENYVHQEECDIGFSIGIPVNAEDYCYFRIKHYEVCAIIHPEHEYANYQELSILDLVNQPIITKNKLFKIHEILETCAKKHQVPLTYALSSPDEILWRFMVENKEGVGIGTTMLENLPKGDLVCLLFKEELPWDIYLLVKKNHFLSKASRDFIEYVKMFIYSKSESKT